jgi:hypothetical protein
MSRYPTDRYEHPELHLALRHLRTGQGLSRPKVVELARERGEALSQIYLAQCEADPAAARDPKSARTPSRAKLEVMLGAMGTTLEEFEVLLAARPWAGPLPVEEGVEWDAAPGPLWERRREELAELYDEASESQRTELLAFARRLLGRGAA